MRLPHDPTALTLVRTPTRDDPWKVLVSGCIMGMPCGVDGTDYGMAGSAPDWLDDPRVRRVAFCPEAHSLGVPRPMPDLHGGDGFAALDGRATVRDPEGGDLTAAMVAGGRAMVDLAREVGVDWALLTDMSAACGTQVVSLGSRFAMPRRYQRGVGVAAALLVRAGFPVVSQRDHRTLALLRQRLDGTPPPEGLRDHHEHPWVLAHLPM